MRVRNLMIFQFIRNIIRGMSILTKHTELRNIESVTYIIDNIMCPYK